LKPEQWVSSLVEEKTCRGEKSCDKINNNNNNNNNNNYNNNTTSGTILCSLGLTEDQNAVRKW